MMIGSLSRLVVFLTITLTCSFGQAQNCASPVTRPEIRELSLTQFQAFANAVNKLYASGASNSIYASMVRTHYNYVPRAHGVPAFFPWHREYLQRFQNALRQIDSSVVIPYWDWTRDAANPALSSVLGNSYYGGNGRSTDRCVVTGSFANWRANVPSQHCLRRQYNNGNNMTPFYSAQNVEAILRGATTSYDQFRQQLEGGPHGTVHVNIGGNSGDMTFMYSPNDPLFWAHHCFIDLLWNEWQQRYPSMANTYNGRENNTNVNVNNILTPFNVPVSQVMNTKANGYCYTYRRWSAALPTSSSRTSRRSLFSRSFEDVLVDVPDSLPESETGTTSDSPLVNTVNTFLNRPQTSDSQVVTTVSQIEEIQQPNPLPESYIRNNNMDLGAVREAERGHKRLAEKINKLVRQYRARHPRRN